jgi:RNA polymerase sigma-70 factor (ECF subfamily)
MDVESDDDRLMNRVRDGDRSAFNRLYAVLSGGLFSFLRNRGVAHDDAADVLQNVFLRVWHSRHQFTGRGARPWVYTIARNCWLDASSAATRRAAHPETSQPSADSSGEDNHIARETAHLLRAALAQLPEQTRDVVLMSRFSSMTTQDIAEVLGISDGNVKVRLHRGLQALKEALHE